jgi:hypothetical protein
MADPNSVQFFTFSLAGPSTVTLATLSAAGGINVGGVAIPGGGFDPELSLYNSSGIRIALDDDSGPGVDALISDSLAAGTYTVALTVFNVFGPENLSDPFPVNANKTFGGFTNTWVVDIVGVQNATFIGSTLSVPDAGPSLPFFAAAVAALAAFRRKMPGNQEP